MNKYLSSGLLVILMGVAKLSADCTSPNFWQLNGTTVATDCYKVTVGTASTGGMLHVVGSETGDQFLAMGPSPDSGPAFNFGYSGFSFGRGSGFFNIRPDSSAVFPNPSIRILTQNVQRIVVDANGTVFINKIPGQTDATTDKLVVNGAIRATSVIGAVYQDFAEWVPATSDLQPGTVVVVDGSSSNTVAPSSQRYDTRVAGVVSAQPGLLLGIEGPSKEMIATTGRVKVRVDASSAPIHLGDLLVTSDKPGVAMRSQVVEIGGVKIHRPGTLIGKALEPLASGEGEILVLLSLQ